MTNKFNLYFNALIFLILLTASGTAAAFGIGLTPSTIELEVQPGSHHRQILKVKNFNPDKAIQLTVSIADWTLDDNGDVKLLPPDESARSASSWVNFSPSVIILEPNTTQQIIVDINAPLALDKIGDHRTSVILSTVLPSKQLRAGKQGVWNRYQMATLFYANVKPGKSAPQISQALLSLNDKKSAQSVAFKITNSGDRHTRLKGSIQLQNSQDIILSENPFEAVILNNQSRLFNTDFFTNKLTPGLYNVIFNISGEGHNLQTSHNRLTFTVEENDLRTH
jgi:P pilus assembly chaperone PapD